MKNPKANIRTAFYSALNAAISYDSVTIPVYEGFGGDMISGANGKYQIVIGEQTVVEDNTKHSFHSDCTQVIEVVTEMKGSGVRKHADAIASSITQLICPTPTTSPLSVTDFQLLMIRVRNINDLLEEGGSSYIARSIITFQFKLTQS